MISDFLGFVPHLSARILFYDAIYRVTSLNRITKQNWTPMYTQTRLGVVAASFILLMVLFVAPANVLANPQGQSIERTDQILKENDAKLLHGPRVVNLKSKATIAINANQTYVPKEVVALIFPDLQHQPANNWERLGVILIREKGGVKQMPGCAWAILEYSPVGYVKDDDADKLQSDEILSALQKNAKAFNEKQKESNSPIRKMFEVTEKPHYDRVTNQLIHAIPVEARVGKYLFSDITRRHELIVTSTLGRRGMITFGYTVMDKQYEECRKIANELLQGLKFNQGERYKDFDEKTDKSAPFTLRELYFEQLPR